jgi:protein-tyrosine phosphatase
MAAAIFARELARRAGERGLAAEDWTVLSAGTWARDGLPASSGAAEAMATRGMDLSDHRSHAITEIDLREADLVLVMTSGHREGLAAEFPFAARRMHLLSRVAGHSYDIADPYGGPQSEYEECANDLQSLIESGFDRIVELVAGSRSSAEGRPAGATD